MPTAGQSYEQQLAMQRADEEARKAAAAAQLTGVQYDAMARQRQDMAGRQQAEQSYQAAMGMLRPPQLQPGQKSMAGPEGQLWRGVQAQQRAGQVAANVRGFNPLAARAAAQSGAEIESQARGAAMGIREADEAARQAAMLQLAQQRSQFEQQQMGLETQAMQQQLQAQAFQQQMEAEERAREAEQEGQIGAGVLNVLGAVGGTLLKSDERLKKDIREATGGSVDDLMAQLGGKRKYVVSDEGNAAEFSGEYGDPANPRTALVYTGDRPVLPQYRAVDGRSQFDRDMAAFMAQKEAEDEAERRQAVMDMYDQAEDESNAAAAQRRALDFSRSGIAITDIGEGGPPLEQRIGYGTVVPREEFRPQVPTREPMEVEARAFNQPFTSGPSAAERAEFVRRMTEGAEAARPATERALASMLGAPPRARVREVPATYEDAARAKRRQQLQSALESMGPAADKTMQGIRPVSFEYQPQVGQPGPKFGVTAQELERTPLGRGMVRETPQGKAIDVGQATGAILGMLGRVNERLRKVEGK